jgi:L-methionine (R)-S-oxide reductase
MINVIKMKIKTSELDTKLDIESSILDKAIKKTLYKKAIKEIKTRLAALEDGIIIPRMATATAVLKSLMPHYLWCGFYFAEEKEMVVGPYQGNIACPNISYKGVCGTAAKNKETLIVPNVHEFKGHIVCDERSNSEIVVPILDKNGMVIAVLDVDSDKKSAFDEVDKKYLERLMPFLLK